MVSFNKYYTSYGLLILGVGLEESEAPLLRDSQHLNPCQTHLTPGLRLKDAWIHPGRLQLGPSAGTGTGSHSLVPQSREASIQCVGF